MTPWYRYARAVIPRGRRRKFSAFRTLTDVCVISKSCEADRRAVEDRQIEVRVEIQHRLFREWFYAEQSLGGTAYNRRYHAGGVTRDDDPGYGAYE